MKKTVSAGVIEAIQQKIDAGAWPKGTQIPSEPELAAQFGVSRATIREAMQELVFSGQINRVRGVGTFVGHKTISYGMNELVSISTLIRQNGYESSIQRVVLDIVRPQKAHIQALGLSGLDPVYKVRRVFAADGKPVVYEEVVYPAKLLAGVKEKDFLDSSFKMLAARGLDVKSSDGCVRPQRATAEMAVALGIPRGAPLLMMETVIQDTNNRKIAHVKDYFTEWFEFPIRRIRR